MNWITGPNRAYGIGEQKSQNAVIKVYTVTELKNALTKIYKLINATGTIQIAGDIIVDSTIKLAEFSNNNRGPSTVTIEAINGAKIICGTNDIILFDMGYTRLDDNNLNKCKYILRNLNLNSDTINSNRFGAIFRWTSSRTNTTDQMYANSVEIYNISCRNITTVFKLDNGNKATAAAADYITDCIIDGLTLDNAAGAISFNINSSDFVCLNCEFSNFNLKNSLATTTGRFNFYSQGDSVKPSAGIIITNIGIPWNIFNSEYTPFSFGKGIVINSFTDDITYFPRISGWTFVGGKFTTTDDRTIFTAGSKTTGYSLAGFDLVGPYKSNGSGNVGVVQQHKRLFEYIAPAATPTVITGPIIPASSMCTIKWMLNISTLNLYGQGSTNYYEIITTAKRGGTSLTSILSNSTINAAETITTILGLEPYATAGGGISMAPYSATNTLYINGSIELTGWFGRAI